ncbi:MAG: peroxiredoxin [Hydrotalea sp.]|nr:peroxiredoxin [Hydrotalea sp.]
MIKVGDNVENEKITVVGKNGGEAAMLHELLGKRTVLFAVPGAFTPTCAMKHLPSYINKESELRAKGVDKILCLAVNDVFVMQAWEKAENSAGHLTMIADGSCALTQKWGLTLDLIAAGLGVRSERYAMVLDGTKITHLFVEGPGEYKVSSAEHVLSQI